MRYGVPNLRGNMTIPDILIKAGVTNKSVEDALKNGGIIGPAFTPPKTPLPAPVNLPQGIGGMTWAGLRPWQRYTVYGVAGLLVYMLFSPGRD